MIAKPRHRVVIVDSAAPGRALLRELLERNVECLHLRSAQSASAAIDATGYDADLGCVGSVSDAIQLLSDMGATAVVPGSGDSVAYAEATAEGLGLPSNALDRFPARAAARAGLATARARAACAGGAAQLIVNSVSRGGRHIITDAWWLAAVGAGQDSRMLLDPETPLADALIAVADRALGRLGVVDGAAHTQLVLTRFGAELVGSVGVLDTDGGSRPVAGLASQASVYASLLAGTVGEHERLIRCGRYARR
jgi:hypothetical protein